MHFFYKSFFTLSFIWLSGYCLAQVPLSKTEFFYDGVEDPYEYDHPVIPKNLKKSEELYNGMRVATNEYKNGLVVFTHQYEWKGGGEYDTNSCAVKGYVYDEKNQLTKKYTLSEENIDITIYDRSQPNKIKIIVLDDPDTSPSHCNFVKKLKSYNELLASSALRNIESEVKGYLSGEYMYNAQKQLTKAIVYKQNKDTLYVVKFTHAKDERWVRMNYYVNGRINDSIKIEYVPNCLYKGMQSKKIKKYEWVRPAVRGSEREVNTYAYAHGAGCKLDSCINIWLGNKIKTVYEYNANEQWLTTKTFEGYRNVLSAMYTRKYDEKGLLINMTKRYAFEKKKIHLYTYRYDFD